LLRISIHRTDRYGILLNNAVALVADNWSPIN
jgi:hypothetical protein